MSDNQAIVKCQ